MRLVAHQHAHCPVGRMGPLTPLSMTPTTSLLAHLAWYSGRNLLRTSSKIHKSWHSAESTQPCCLPSAPHPTSISPPSSSYPLSFHAADKKFDSPLSSASACLRFCINLALIQNLALFPLAHLRTTRTTPTIQPTNSLEPGCLSPLSSPLAPANPLLSSSPSVRPSAKLHCLQRPRSKSAPNHQAITGIVTPRTNFLTPSHDVAVDNDTP